MLNHKKFGETGEVLIILHGLFGSLDNWQSMAQLFSKSLTVFIVDQRNHGKSPHFDEHDYGLMAADLSKFMEEHGIQKAHLLGHSMGGKTVMQFAVNYPHMIDKMIVADIAPKYYPPHHQQIISALSSVNFKEVGSRKEVEVILARQIPEPGVRQFLLKGLTWKAEHQLGWKFNFKVLKEKIDHIGEALDGHVYFTNPVLFLKGEHSSYILEDDIELIEACFPMSDLQEISGAGHWLHAENPQDFSQIVLSFLK